MCKGFTHSDIDNHFSQSALALQ